MKGQAVLWMSSRWRPEYLADLVAARRRPALELQTGKRNSFNNNETMLAHCKRVSFKTNFFRLNIKQVINH